ncbi:MAG: hypothetical protein WCH91_14495, partial [bacterium]
MGISDLFRRPAAPEAPPSTAPRDYDAPRNPDSQPQRRFGGQTRTEIRTTRRARIRDLREKVELANLK